MVVIDELHARGVKITRKRLRPLLTSSDYMPHAIFVPEPEYTDQARKKKIQGTVVVSLTVTVDGTTRDIKVVKGVGYGLDTSGPTGNAPLSAN